MRNSQNEITNTKTESENTQNAFALGIAVRKTNNNYLQKDQPAPHPIALFNEETATYNCLNL